MTDARCYDTMSMIGRRFFGLQDFLAQIERCWFTGSVRCYCLKKASIHICSVSRHLEAISGCFPPFFIRGLYEFSTYLL